jgi:ankyrin repeat protein
MSDNNLKFNNNSQVDKLKELFEYIEQGDGTKVNEILSNNEISKKALNSALAKVFVKYKISDSTREIVNALLSFKADPDLVVGKSTLMNCLLLAAQENDAEMAKLLLGYGAKVNYIDSAGKSALIHVLQSGKPVVDDFVELLIGYNADVNLCDAEGNSPLIVATQRGMKSIVMLLLDTTIDVDYANVSNGNTALHFAVIHNRFEIVQMLLERKAKMTVLNRMGQTAVDLAMHMNRTEMYSLLAEEYNKIEEAIQVTQQTGKY